MATSQKLIGFVYSLLLNPYINVEFFSFRFETRGMFGKHMLRGFKWPPGRLHFKEFSTFKLGFYDDVPLRSTLG